MPNWLSGIPLTLDVAGSLRQEDDEMEPRQLVSRVLTNSEIWADPGELLHVFRLRVENLFISGNASHRFDASRPMTLALHN